MHEVRVPLNAVKLGLTSVADIIDASSSNVTVNDVSKNNYDDDEEYNLKKKEKNEIIETLRYVDGAIDGMAETLNDVLSFAAIEEGRFRLNCSQFNVNKLLKNAQATHLPTAEEKQISIEVHIDERLQSLILYGDHRRIANCIGNFCSNALKFSTSGGQVLLHASLYDNVQDSDCLNFPPSSTISSSVPETKDCDIIGNNRDDDDDDHSKKRAIGLKIEVRDNGCGIDFNDQRTLFQPFSQIRPGELQQGRGSGLGLAISKESIERHGGSIGLESTPGVGSTFFIHVPLAIISENIDNASSQSLNNETNSQSSSLKIQDEKNHHTRKALVVDDVFSNRRLFRRQIERLGFSVTEAEDGITAIEKCGYSVTDDDYTNKNSQYDVIFMDSVMPRMSGPEATSILRHRGCKTILIAVTGNALEEDVRSFLEAGANEVLTKPVSKSKLQLCLQRFNII
eukprot:CAMPEP_0197291054 /NCGR_PEP_ID=MMETSP0890-20130614/11614_1 /TAXON_ID=44058 ORGANISM="Aureoumbra lagunensis, Strain CCMP1510" /NCGR_SAMPLE_ID=MMETSP0890 /ASSEMBLY_ACC=CAM_ASM_000533 /LENGTH=453 /DNA_ID=CAMNT_0042763579 /DNA_START=1472 /DNA_END=2833 /DNA_ORIENTATION=+